MRLCDRDIPGLALGAIVLASLAGSGCAALKSSHGLPRDLLGEREALDQAPIIQPGQPLYLRLVDGREKPSQGAESQALPQLSGKYTVQRNGAIELGPYGFAHVAGLTPAQAEMTIRALLAEHLAEPQVSLEVLDSTGRSLFARNERSGEKKPRFQPQRNQDANASGVAHAGESSLTGVASRFSILPPEPRDQRPPEPEETKQEQIEPPPGALAGANSPRPQPPIAPEKPTTAAAPQLVQPDSSGVPELIRVSPRTALMPPRSWRNQDEGQSADSPAVGAQVIESAPGPREPIAIASSIPSRVPQPPVAPVRLLMGEVGAKPDSSSAPDVVVVDPPPVETEPLVHNSPHSSPDSSPGPKKKVVYRRVAASRPAADSRPADPFQPVAKQAAAPVDPFQPQPVDTKRVDPFEPQPVAAQAAAPSRRNLRPFSLPTQDASPAPQKQRPSLFSRPSP